MSWCPYDSSYLLTCSKDNRTICWDTVSGEVHYDSNILKSWNYINILFHQYCYLTRVSCTLHYLLQIMSELPASSNGNFDIHWYRKIPGVVAASSFDVKIGIYNLEVIYLFSVNWWLYQSIMSFVIH